VLQLLATVYGGGTEAALGLGSGSEFTLVSTLSVLVSHKTRLNTPLRACTAPSYPPLPLLRAHAVSLSPSYGWIPHNAGFGFLDLTPATLGQIHF
jgi:hypothetical protein